MTAPAVLILFVGPLIIFLPFLVSADLKECVWDACVDVKVYNGRPENLSHPQFYIRRGILLHHMRTILPGRYESTMMRNREWFTNHGVEGVFMYSVADRQLVIGVCAPVKPKESRLGIGLTKREKKARGREYFEAMFFGNASSQTSELFESFAIENLATINKKLTIRAGDVTVLAYLGDKMIDTASVQVL